MKNDNPQSGRSTKEIRELFGQIKGAEILELATKAYVAGLRAPYYSELLLDCDGVIRRRHN